MNLSGVVAEEPTLTPAEVLALVENLPPESATVAGLRGVDESIGWTNSTYLLASILDAVREGTFANMQVRTKKKLKQPERIPVPGVEPSKKVNQFVAMAQAQYKLAGRL